MHIYIEQSFDDDLLRKYDESQATAFYSIFVLLGDHAFPDDHWMDFGTVILDWWILACIELLDGKDLVNFRFMDGPFEIRFKKTPEVNVLDFELKPGGNVGTILISDLIAAVKMAAVYALNYLSNINVDKKTCNYLRLAVEKLDRKSRSVN